MKYALLSDIHSNLEAFQAVIEDCEKEKVDGVFFLGDIVGYGADPVRCIEILQELTTHIIAGNHDWAAVGLTETDLFNPAAKIAIEWTASAYKDISLRIRFSKMHTTVFTEVYYIPSRRRNAFNMLY